MLFKVSTAFTLFGGVSIKGLWDGDNYLFLDPGAGYRSVLFVEILKFAHL